MARAAREGDHLVVAGAPVSDEEQEEALRELVSGRGEATPISDWPTEAHIAFGRFVNLMRRRRGLSIEAFAEQADVDPGELLAIEDDVHFIPEPRTVYRLALVFKLSQDRLMQLAGLTKARDLGLRAQAVRFAASADPVKELSPEEATALETFVAVLSRGDRTTG